METRKETAAHVSVSLPQGANKRRKESREAVYNAPAGYVIMGYKHIVKSSLGPVTYDIDMVAANSKFVSKSDLSSSYNDAINLLANLGYKGADLAKIKADLTTSYKQLESYQSQLSASHQTIAHTGTVTGAGMFNGRSIYKGHLEVTIAEVPAPIRSRAAAQQYFKKIIDNFKPSGSNGQNGTAKTVKIEYSGSLVIFDKAGTKILEV
jgi:hypothetical protein